MKYENEVWSIDFLIDLINEKSIDLSPDYQRNDIWSIKMQKNLIATIKRGWPLPNFFVLKKGSDYEMVDGQQRSRAILAYIRGNIADEEGNEFNQEKAFLEYPLSVTVILKIDSSEKIEDYYTLVNSSGAHLNRPELFKAKYYDTRFLVLTQKLAQHEVLKKIRLFKQSTLNRMNDVDFVSELITGLEYGITDKKLKVDGLFEKDIDEKKAATLKQTFNQIMDIVDALDDEYSIQSTRYKQRNDFYTLFLLFHELVSVDISIIKYFYHVLRSIGGYISPSQDRCETLKQYALNCVTQSNSKTARQTRHDIITGLLMNKNKGANDYQDDVLAFFGLPSSAIVKRGNYYTLDAEQIENAEPDI